MAGKNSKSKRTEVHGAHDRYANEEAQYLTNIQSQKDKKSVNKVKTGKGQSPVIDNRMKTANKNAEQLRKIF